MKIPLLTGSPDYDWKSPENAEKYNGALLINPDSWKIDRYIKINLVPFSEKVPLSKEFPFLYEISKKMDLDIGDFTPGDSLVIFQFKSRRLNKPVQFAVLICYESVFPYFVQQFVARGAQFLIVKFESIKLRVHFL